ncbi:hypothetical protein HZS_2291, partial [Henneguya salminicola]
MKLLDIIQICLSQENTISYLRSQNLLSTEQKCKKCRNEMILSSTADTKSKDGEIWRCYKKKCDQTRSIRHKFFFKSSKLSLGQILLLIHLWAKQYPQNLIVEDLDFAKQTITDWSRFCRDLCM